MLKNKKIQQKDVIYLDETSSELPASGLASPFVCLVLAVSPFDAVL